MITTLTNHLPISSFSTLGQNFSVSLTPLQQKVGTIALAIICVVAFIVLMIVVADSDAKVEKAKEHLETSAHVLKEKVDQLVEYKNKLEIAVQKPCSKCGHTLSLEQALRV